MYDLQSSCGLATTLWHHTINHNYHSSLMFQIRVQGLSVAGPFGGEADSCMDAINKTHIRVTSADIRAQTH